MSNHFVHFNESATVGQVVRSYFDGEIAGSQSAKVAVNAVSSTQNVTLVNDRGPATERFTAIVHSVKCHCPWPTVRNGLNAAYNQIACLQRSHTAVWKISQLKSACSASIFNYL